MKSLRALARTCCLAPATVSADLRDGARRECESPEGYDVAKYLRWRQRSRRPQYSPLGEPGRLQRIKRGLE